MTDQEFERRIKMICVICLILFVLGFLLLVSKVYAGTSFTQLSKSVTYITLDKIEEQRKEALKASQRGLSRERLAEIEAQARGVLNKAAMVFCSSTTIGE